MNEIRITKRKLNNLYQEIDGNKVELRSKTALPEDIREDVVKIMKKRGHNKETFYTLESIVTMFGYSKIIFKG